MVWTAAGCFRPGPAPALIHTRIRKAVCKPRTNIIICLCFAYMVRSIFIMRTKSLQIADKLIGLFAAGGHGRGWPDPAIPAGEIGPHEQGRGRHSEQISKKKGLSDFETVVSKDAANAVGVINATNATNTVSASRVIFVFTKNVTPKILRKNKKDTFEDCAKTVIKSAFVVMV